MKLKTKFAALAATVCLLGGALVGCGDDPEPTPVVNKYYVTPPQASADYEVAGINAEGYDAGATVTFTVTMKTEMKVIKNVKWESTVITAGTDGKYSFTMPEKNVTISVALDSYVLSISGKLEVGEKGTVKLNLGNDAIQDFAVEGKTDADKAKITLVGKEITFDEVGEVTLVATRVNKVVAEKKFTISESTKVTILKSFTDAWANVEGFADNTKSGSAIVSTADPVELEGQVIFVGNPYTSGSTTTVELLIDDGSMIVQTTCKLASADEAWTACAVGDVIKINQKLSNATGLLQANRLSAQRFITKVEGKSYTPQASKVYTADEYKAAAAVFEKNDQMRLPIPMEIDVVGAPEEVSGAMKDRFLVKGVTPNEGSVINKLALSKSVVDTECVEGASYHIKGVLLSKGSAYLNFVAFAFTKSEAQSVTIKGDSERTLKVNETLKLEYETTPAGSGKVVEWVSSDSTKVKVENGTVTALVKGAEETIKVVVDGHESNAITIKVPNVSLTALEISGELTTKEYYVGEALDVAGLKVTATFDDETSADYTELVQWTVDPATFEAEGEAVGVSIKAKYETVESAAFAASVKVTLEDGYDADHPMMADKAYAKASKMASGAETAKEYYIKGVVVSKGNWSDKYKNVSVDLDAGDGNKFVLFRVAAETQADADAFVKGAVVLAKAKITNYSGTCETVAGPEIVSMTATEVTLVEISGSSTVNVGADLLLAATTYPTGVEATVVWDSDPKTIATVDQTGKVTGVAEGEATITATVGTLVASYEVTVASAGQSSVETTMAAYVTAHSCTVSVGQDVTLYTSLQLDDHITMSTSGEANCGSFWAPSAGTDWRLYQAKKGDVTIAAGEGYKVLTVKITYTNSNDGVLKNAAGQQVDSDTVVEVNGASVTFTVGNSGTKTNGQVRITGVLVAYAAA